jgi:Tol biopolymer transport system component/uncharacterized RDD family membrane protein YckC
MALRFNPPPNWPLPQGFSPPPGWQPDPRWPPRPFGWPLWIEEKGTTAAGLGPEASPAATTVDPMARAVGVAGVVRVAPHRYRLAAFAVDLLIVLVVFGVLAVLGRVAEEALKVDLVDVRTTVIALAICIVAYLGLTVWLTNGQTIGKALFGLVERRVDGKPLSPTAGGFGWAIGRHSVGYLVVDVLGVGTLAALASPRRRCLHDLAFSSEVLFVSREDAWPMTWRDCLNGRLKAFIDNLESGERRIKKRHHRLAFLWRWLTWVITTSTGAVFAIAKLVLPASATSHAPGTAAAGSVHPAAALATKPAAVLWASTATATAGAGLAIAVALSGTTVGQINVAFDSETSGQPETDEIYLMHADGSHLRQLTQNTSADGGPRLFRDRLITFTSDRDGNYEIYVMNADGSRQRRLTNNAANDTEPDWSADGRQITFVSDRDGTDQIYVMNADGSRQRRLTNNPANDTEPDWSADGRQITFVSDRDGTDQIYVMNADGSRQRRLTDNAANDTEPVWAPSGRQIAFVSDRDGDHEIYVMNANGSSQRRLTRDPADDRGPFWGLGGRKILFASNRGMADPDSGEIWAMNPDGTGGTRLTFMNRR